MSKTSFFKNKPKQWWHIWSCSRCDSAVKAGDNTLKKGLDKSEETRAHILMAAFDEIYRRGFQAASLSNILKKTNITKGALYHHFKNKMELGYAVVDEVIYTTLRANWIEPLLETDDPIPVIQQILHQSGQQMTEEDVRLGCPLNNLAQEMSPIDEGFRNRIQNFFKFWQKAIADALKRGQQQGIVDSSINTENCALFILSSIEGVLGMTKNHQDKEVFYICGRELERYLNALKAT